MDQSWRCIHPRDNSYKGHERRLCRPTFIKRIFLDRNLVLASLRSLLGASRAILDFAAKQGWKLIARPRVLNYSAYWNDLARAVRRAVGILQAFKILSLVIYKFPEDAMTNYNLGCHHCQMGDIAKKLKNGAERRFRLMGFRILALDDFDLEPF